MEMDIFSSVIVSNVNAQKRIFLTGLFVQKRNSVNGLQISTKTYVQKRTDMHKNG